MRPTEYAGLRVRTAIAAGSIKRRVLRRVDAIVGPAANRAIERD